MRIHTLSFTLALSTLSTLTTAQVTWQNVLPAASLGTTFDHAMACDPVRKRVVMFGGLTYPGAATNETFEWDGLKWHRALQNNPPSPRRNMAMAYDSSRRHIVMFGGGNWWAGPGPVQYTDTWTWDGSHWRDVTPTGPNPPPGSFAMCFDSHRSRMVLYAESATNNPWEWDGATWRDLSQAGGPAKRAHAALAYDEKRRRAVLFGGTIAGRGHTDETWEWDGSRWTDVTPATGNPHPREEHAMVYDPERGRIIMFGGFWLGTGPNPNHPLGDTWAWDGKQWTELAAPASPAPRQKHGMAFDREHGTVVVYGGAELEATKNFRDTWEATFPSTATVRSYGTGCGSPPAQLTVNGGLAIGRTLTATTRNLPPNTLIGTLAIGASNTHLNGVPILPLDLALFGLPGCHLYHSYDFTWTFPVIGGVGYFVSALPYNSAFVGARIHLQCASGRVATNAIEAVVGR